MVKHYLGNSFQTLKQEKMCQIVFEALDANYQQEHISGLNSWMCELIMDTLGTKKYFFNFDVCKASSK